MTWTPNNLSPERRERAVDWLAVQQIATRPDLTDGARLLAALGLLVCDNDGRVTKADLDAAAADPSIVQAAHQLLERSSRPCPG